MSFARAIAFLDPQEGEWADDTRDHGGRTRWGISERAHPGVDLDTLTREGAHVIYEERYWRRRGVSRLPWPASLAVFDWNVHSGSRAMKTLQIIVGLSGPSIDGWIGDETMEAVNRYLQTHTAADLAYALLNSRRDFMVRGFRNGRFDATGRDPLWALGGFWKRTLDLAREIGRAEGG